MEKVRSALLGAQRGLNVVRLAQQGAEDDVARVITEHAADWAVELAAEGERAREAERATIDALADALRRLGDAGSARLWLDTSVDEGRFDRRARGVVAASAAPSSRRTIANARR